MIAYPIDAALIKDHVYHDTGNLDVVLDPETFYHDGTFQRTRDYGLGYFNYQLRRDEEILSPNKVDHWRGIIYDHFFCVFICLIVCLGLWIAYFLLDWHTLLWRPLAKVPFVNKLGFIRRRGDECHNYGSQYSEELEYHYIKS